MAERGIRVVLGRWSVKIDRRAEGWLSRQTEIKKYP